MELSVKVIVFLPGDFAYFLFSSSKVADEQISFVFKISNHEEGLNSFK